MDAEATPSNINEADNTVAPLLIYENIDFSDSLTSFKIDDNFRLAFNEEVIAGSGEIVISNGTDTRIIAIDDTSQVTFDELGGVTIDLAEDLIVDTTYQVQMASGVITNTEGNPFAGFDISGTQTKASEPAFYSSNLHDGSTFKTNGKIALNFDEKVMAGSGDIVISNDRETLTIPITDTSQVIFDKSESHEYGSVIIDPENDLTVDSNYTIQLDEGVITDTTGNPFKGFSDISLTTTASAPSLLSSSPSNGEQAKAGSRIHLLFDEKVTAGNGEIIFTNGTDTRVTTIDDTSRVSFDEAGGVTIAPPENLVADTSYSVQMAGGVITDTNGEPFAGFSEATFIPTTYSGPLLAGINFPDTNRGITQLIFDEPVIAGSGNFIVSGFTIENPNAQDGIVQKKTITIPVDDPNQVIFDNNENGSVIIRPHFPFIDSTYLWFGNGVITDTEGNPFPGIPHAVASDPILLASSPGNDSSKMKVDNEIKLFFDEKVVAGSGDIVFSNGTDTRIVPINDTDQVNFDESGGVVIDLSEDLIANTTYQVQMANGVIKDTTGNNYTGFNDAKISVTDSTPLLLTSNPTNGSALKSDEKIS